MLPNDCLTCTPTQMYNVLCIMPTRPRIPDTLSPHNVELKLGFAGVRKAIRLIVFWLEGNTEWQERRRYCNLQCQRYPLSPVILFEFIYIFSLECHATPVSNFDVAFKHFQLEAVYLPCSEPNI